MNDRQGRLRVMLATAGLIVAALACSLGSGTSSERADPQTAPIVLLLAPENASVFAEGAQVELHALVEDIQGRAARLEFRVDEVPVAAGEASDPAGQETLTARATWTAAGQSKHVLTVEAFRPDGLSLGLSDIVISVVPPPAANLVNDGPQAQAAPVTSEPTAIPTSTPIATAPETDIGILTGPTARVVVAELNIRQGPDTSYPPVGTLRRGDLVQIVGRNADSSWWAVSYRGGSAWVFSALVAPEGDVSNVPLVAPPP